MRRPFMQPTSLRSPDDSGGAPLYRNFTSQAEINAQYDVENSVSDLGRYVDFFRKQRPGSGKTYSLK